MDVRIKARVKARVRTSIRNAIHHFRIRVQLRALSRKHPVLVYQMGKVGSSTVVKTLNNLNLKRGIDVSAAPYEVDRGYCLIEHGLI